MGIFRDFRSFTLRSSLSTQSTLWPRSARQAPVMSPTWPVPMIEMFMCAAVAPRSESSIGRRRDHLSRPVEVTSAQTRLPQEFRDRRHQESVLVPREIPLEDDLDREIVKVPGDDQFLVQV